jgi:hypothetical protein
VHDGFDLVHRLRHNRQRIADAAGGRHPEEHQSREHDGHAEAPEARWLLGAANVRRDLVDEVLTGFRTPRGELPLDIERIV